MTLTVPGSPSPTLCTLEVEGRARIAGIDVVRPVVPSEDMMQAFFYRHLVPSEELVVAVNGPSRRPNLIRAGQTQPIRIPAGGTAKVPLNTLAGTFQGPLRFELDAPPAGITLQTPAPAPGETELVLASDSTTTTPGLKGNLIIQAYTTGRANSPDQKDTPRRSLGVLPAVPFEIVDGSP
jgi:hypothetical protein